MEDSGGRILLRVLGLAIDGVVSYCDRRFGHVDAPVGAMAQTRTCQPDMGTR